MKFPLGNSQAGLVIRAEDVHVLSMQGKKVETRVRVALEGKDDQRLAQAIQQAVAQAALKTRKLAVAVPIQDVLVRFFTLPRIPKPEWDRAVQFEVRKYIPFKTESLIWDYHVINPSVSHPGAGGQASPDRLEVVFAGLPRETFDSLQAALAAAGVQPTLLEPVSLSLARLAARARAASPNDFVCLVDLERERAHIVIARDGVPYLTRDVSLPAQGQEAGAAEGVPAAQLRIQRLLSELRVSMDFFAREYSEASIGRTFIFGDPDLVGPWDQWVAGQLPGSIELGNALLETRAEGEPLPMSFASSVGLLHAEHAPMGASLDFLKRSQVTVRKTPRVVASGSAQGMLEQLKTPQMAMVAGMAVALLVGFWALGAQQVSRATHELEQLAGAQSAVGKGLDGKSERELQTVHEQIQQQLTLLTRIANERVSLAAKLDALARSIPDGVWFTGLTYTAMVDTTGKSQVTMTVNGACYLGASGKELDAIQEFAARVKRSPKLLGGGSAQLGQISAQDAPQAHMTYRTFALNCQPGKTP